ncbi:MAG: tetratricopeptide repeat protein, partial [Chloroflexota bacterium]
MNVYRKRAIFRRRSESNVYRMFFWVILILSGIWLIRSVQRGDVKPLFLPTATPTRMAESYKLEAEALFTAGKLNDAVDANGNVISIGAITAYQQALRVNTNDAQALAELARIQTYSTQLLTTDVERKQRLDEAIASIDQAVEIAPDDSLVHAVRSFVLDWNANKSIVCTPAELAERGTCQEYERLLTEADREATRALQLNSSNTLALAYFA